MTYLLTLGWPWFAAAAALGAVVGFLSATRDEAEASSAGGRVAAAGLLLLLVGGLVSWLEALDGRAATTLDIALLAGLAYAVGLPLGGAARSLGRKPARPALPAPTPLLVAPAVPAPSPKPSSTPPIIVPAAAPSTPAATPQTSEPRPAGARKAPPGLRPAMLSEPHSGRPDDLARIKGVGPKSVEKLHALGVFHYDQIAEWTLENARWIGAAIGAPGRVERDKWIQQARALLARTGTKK
jgi:predicted flap endonuclease-1-like 5' DNA nuclease